MKAFFALGIMCLAASLTFGPDALAQDAIKQEAQTKHYHFVLQIGPLESMYTADEARARHPENGEVMLSGRMAAMTMREMSHDKDDAQQANIRHLELHAYSRLTNKPLIDAHVTIKVIGADRRSRLVPIARMYGVTEGLDDLHYGNNVVLSPGLYTIETLVNGERARFQVTLAQGS